MSFSNLASGNRHCSWSLSDGFFPFNFGWFPHTRALVPTLLSVLGGHLQVSGFFFCASLSSRVLCPAKSSMLISSEPQLRLLSSVSLPSGSPSLHRSLDGEVSPGGKQGSPRARLLSSLSRRGHSPLLPHVQCCEDYCLINFVCFFFFHCFSSSGQIQSLTLCLEEKQKSPDSRLSWPLDLFTTGSEGEPSALMKSTDTRIRSSDALVHHFLAARPRPC